jgi:hypothetical protein
MVKMATHAKPTQLKLKRDPALTVTLALILYSLVVYPLILLLEFHQSPTVPFADYKTYFEAANWAGYPAFFLMLAPALWLSWNPFLLVWKKIAETGVLQGNDNRPPNSFIGDLVSSIAATRWIALLLAVLVSAFINIADSSRSKQMYSAPTYLSQLEVACKTPNFFGKWLFEAWPGTRTDDNTFPGCAKGKVTSEVDPKWAGKRAPAKQIAVAVIVYFQQVAIVTLASLAFFQLLLHTGLFAFFERLPFSRKQGLRLELNAESPLNEFGLEHWNHALNNFYWAVTPALVGAFVSRASVTDPMLMAPGQKFMNILIPLVVLTPMLVTIIVRQARLPALWEKLKPHGPIDPEKYHHQRLWPLDQNWSSKLGIILAFAMSGLVLGIQISDLIRL